MFFRCFMDFRNNISLKLQQSYSYSLKLLSGTLSGNHAHTTVSLDQSTSTSIFSVASTRKQSEECNSFDSCTHKIKRVACILLLLQQIYCYLACLQEGTVKPPSLWSKAHQCILNAYYLNGIEKLSLNRISINKSYCPFCYAGKN